MSVSHSAALLSAILGVVCLTESASAQNRSDYRVATSTPAVTQKPKFTFILFYKE